MHCDSEQGALTVIFFENRRESINPGEWVGCFSKIELEIRCLDRKACRTRTNDFYIRGMVDGKIIVEEEVIWVPCSTGIQSTLISVCRGSRLIEEFLFLCEAIISL